MRLRRKLLNLEVEDEMKGSGVLFFIPEAGVFPTVQVSLSFSELR